jgi:hypothetical protein
MSLLQTKAAENGSTLDVARVADLRSSDGGPQKAAGQYMLAQQYWRFESSFFALNDLQILHSVVSIKLFGYKNLTRCVSSHT